MLADFYIPRLSNDMKIEVKQNHLGAQILYRSLVPPTKRRQMLAIAIFYFSPTWGRL